MSDQFSLEKVSDLIKDLLGDTGFRLYDIAFNEVSKHFRIFIDREEGVTIADCKKISMMISKLLDGLEFITFSYSLEVSSPGIRRPLKRPEHYYWAVGKLIEVNLGEQRIKGYLRKVNTEGIIIASENGENFIPYASIVSANVMEEIEYGKRR